jgi:hypothetical protein
MALEATFRHLSAALHKVDDAFSALLITVGDTPPNDQTALADALENTVLDIMGTVHETLTSVLQAQKAVEHPKDLESARHALALCQKGFHGMEQQFASDLVSFEKLKELARLGHERRGWLPWANSIRQGIEQCRQPLEEMSMAVASCWQELAECGGSVSISIKATNVGQQITVGKPKLEDSETEGIA